MESFIKDLTDRFEKSVPETEKDLVQAFNQYLNRELNRINEKGKITDEKQKKYILAYMTKNMIDKDLDGKKRELIKDENMAKIRSISISAFEYARNIVNGRENIEEIDAEDKKREISELLNKVQSFNKQEAKRLVSEGILDLNFISNPESEIVSLRLGREICERKTRGEER